MDVRRLLPLPLLAVVAAGALRVSTLFSASAVVSPDTYDYAGQSRLSLLDPAFWGSQHPPLLPLLWKPLPGLVAAVDPVKLGDLGPALFLNAIVGAVCWGVLALTVASLAETRRVRAIALLGILALSLAPEVSGWDSAAISESVSLSLTALALALAIRYVRDPSRAPATALALGLVANAVIRHGDAAWFRAHGMPWRPDTPALLGERPASAFKHDPRARDLRRWLDRDGRSAWIDYLGSHPARSLSLGHNLPGLIDPPRGMLEQYWSGGRSPVSFFPRGVLLAFLAAFSLVGAALVARTKQALLLGSWLAATLPVALLIWVLDAAEFDRHAIALPVLLRIVVIALGVLTLDSVLALLAQRGSYAAQSIPKYVGASYERSSPAKPSPTAP